MHKVRSACQTVLRAAVMLPAVVLLSYPSAALAQVVDQSDVKHFLLEWLLEKEVAFENQLLNRALAEFVDSEMLVLSARELEVLATAWALEAIDDQVYLFFDFLGEPWMPEDGFLISHFDGHSLKAVQPHMEDQGLEIRFRALEPIDVDSRAATSHALLGRWVVAQIDEAVVEEEMVGFEFFPDGSFSEFAAPHEALALLPRPEWPAHPDFVDDLKQPDWDRFDVKATLRVDPNASDSVAAFLVRRVQGARAHRASVDQVAADQIEVHLQGVADPDIVAVALQARRSLEFRLMAAPEDVAEARATIQNVLAREGTDDVLQALPGGDDVVVGLVAPASVPSVDSLMRRPEVAVRVPATLELMWHAGENDWQFDEPVTYLLGVRAGSPELTGAVVTEAYATADPFTRQPQISLSMSAEGAVIWSELTERNVGRQVAMIVDGVVYSFPRIIHRIDGGQTTISGVSAVEAERLAVTLTPGELPAPAVIVNVEVAQSTVDAALLEARYRRERMPEGWLTTYAGTPDGAGHRVLPDLIGPTLVLRYKDELPATFVITEINSDSVVLLAAFPFMHGQTVTLRRHGPE